jgi:hypothetical protein
MINQETGTAEMRFQLEEHIPLASESVSAKNEQFLLNERL